MPRLSYPGGRKAAAREEPKPDEVDNEALSVDEGQVRVPDDQEVRTSEPVETDPSEALKAQIEALRKSEREALARADTAERKAAEEANRRATEGQSSQEQIMNSQVEAIGAAWAAAKSEHDMAKDAIRAAIAMQDGEAQAEAYSKMSTASARMFQLEQGKEAAERELKVFKETPKPEVRPQDDVAATLDRTQLPYLAKKWLKEHSEYVLDPRKNARIQALHYDLLEDGIEPYSSEYFEAAEQRLGLRPAPKSVVEDDVEDEPIAPRRSQAPPSREVPSSSGTRTQTSITLSIAQKEAARVSGVTEKVYAEQLLKLRQEKLNGNYGGGP